jgi:hypothetical protein
VRQKSMTSIEQCSSSGVISSSPHASRGRVRARARVPAGKLWFAFTPVAAAGPEEGHDLLFHPPHRGGDRCGAPGPTPTADHARLHGG